MPVSPESVAARLAAFYFAYFAYAGALLAYFPPYLASRGLGAAEIAWVLALPQFIRIVAPAPWGWLADRTGAQRGIVVFACAVNAALFAALPHAAGFAGIAWMIGIAALLTAAALPLVEAIALRALAGQAGRYGPVRLWGSVGFIGAVLGGGAWLDARAIDTLPAILAALGLVSFVGALLLPRVSRPAHAVAGSTLIPKPALALLAAGFCMAAAHGTLYAFFTLHLQREGYSVTWIGLAWTLGVLAEIVVFLCLPVLVSRYSLSTILMASCACGVIRFVTIGWGAGIAWLLLAAQLLHAATFGSFHAAAVAAVHKVFPSGAEGRGQTLFSSFAYGAGGATGALLAGWAWETWGPGWAFAVSSIASGAGLLFAYPLRRAGL
jgi:MFS transporter, PPP family, 3-phenylpropionic acid transporter